MELTDTHAHLANSRLAGEIAPILERAAREGVTRIISIGSDTLDSAQNVELAAAHGPIFAAAGVHPTSIHEVPDDWLHRIRQLLDRPKVVALGEIGLDYYHPPRDQSPVADWRARQAHVFRLQLDLALEKNLPVVIHQRNCAAEVLEVMRGYAGRLQAVFHCFTGTPHEAEELIRLGFHLSFTGVITYPSAAELAACAARLPLDRIMVETDAPYLTPVPHRGTRNEPAYVRHTAAFLAQARGISLEEFAEATTDTARRFFRGLD